MILGGGGLGRAAAYDLARAGVTLALCDRDAQRLEETVDTIRGEGGQVALAEVMAARDRASLEKFVSQADKLNGGTFASAGWFNWSGTGYRNSPPADMAKFLAEKVV